VPNRWNWRFGWRIRSGDGIAASFAVEDWNGVCHCAASQSKPQQSIAKDAQQSDGDAGHRANGNKIDGAVITLVDLKGRKDSYAGKTPRCPK
jgi:hypothetical protein